MTNSWSIRIACWKSHHLENLGSVGDLVALNSYWLAKSHSYSAKTLKSWKLIKSKKMVNNFQRIWSYDSTNYACWFWFSIEITVFQVSFWYNQLIMPSRHRSSYSTWPVGLTQPIVLGLNCVLKYAMLLLTIESDLYIQFSD